METYKVKQEDLIGELEGFPIEVVQKMIERQVGVKIIRRDFNNPNIHNKNENKILHG